MDAMLAECQRVIGYAFANPALLDVALTHSSLRTPDRECNERLEFLGDSVLGLVVTEELYRLLPDQAEGELTRLKSAVVSRGALFRASQRLGLARFAEFARGVGHRDELPVSVTANLVESVIGAIYLDAGWFPAREFVLRHLGAELEETLNDRGAKNFKSLLQHEAQEALGVTPTYRTLEEGGPDHRKQFVVAAVLRGQEWGRAAGPTKKEAEQESARVALEAFQRRGRGRRRRRSGHEADGREPAAHVDEWVAAAPDPREEASLLDHEPRGAASSARRSEPIAPEPDVDPSEPAPAPAPPLPIPPLPSTPPRAPARRSPPSPAPRAPAPPSADGFADGLGRVAPAAPPALPPAPPAPAPDAVPARKKAPAAWSPPAAGEGFDSGL